MGMACVAASLAGGCAVGEVGALHANVTHADGAVVVEIAGHGLWLRGRDGDAGLSLGYSRRVYVFPADAAGLPAEGRHLFAVALPEAASVAAHSETYGLELRAAAAELSLTVGVASHTQLALIDAEEAVAYRLRFDAGRLDRTQFVRFDQGGRGG
jgi:hypothetical protein